VSSANGAICLDVLKDQWSPALTLKTALLSVQSLLASPEPKDPQDAVVARQYMGEHELFVRTAKQWTQQYASECALPVKALVHTCAHSPSSGPGRTEERARRSAASPRWGSKWAPFDER